MKLKNPNKKIPLMGLVEGLLLDTVGCSELS